MTADESDGYRRGFVNGYRKALLDHGIDPNADEQTAVTALEDHEGGSAMAAKQHGRIAERKALSALQSDETTDIRWAVNVLLEKIAAKFEANDTWDIWRSDAAALVRSFKHDLSALKCDGWQLVPKEPTQAMIDAVASDEQIQVISNQDTSFREIWRNMLDAAPALIADKSDKPKEPPPPPDPRGTSYRDGWGAPSSHKKVED